MCGREAALLYSVYRKTIWRHLLGMNYKKNQSSHSRTFFFSCVDVWGSGKGSDVMNQRYSYHSTIDYFLNLENVKTLHPCEWTVMIEKITYYKKCINIQYWEINQLIRIQSSTAMYLNNSVVHSDLVLS